MRPAALSRLALLTASLTAFAAMPALAADAPSTFTDAQRAEIESIIKDYLVNKNPEVMAQGMQKLQQREQAEADTKTKQEVAAYKDKIFNDANTPVGGNPKGSVTVVEFFDYQCGYCKMSEPSLDKLLKEDKNIKLIYKDFPVLGPVSAEAAKAALASVRQGKYQAMHDALMGKKEHLTSDMIYATAKDAGVDVDKMKKDMADSSITDQIAANLKLGQDIGVRGTPMFIIGNDIYPGALQYDQMKQAVADAAHTAEKK